MLVIISKDKEFRVKLYINGVEKTLYASSLKKLITIAKDYYNVDLISVLN